MNVSDSELVTSILAASGYSLANDETAADVILLNTCAIRDGAEQKVWGKLRTLKSVKSKELPSPSRQPVIGVLGCMAERLKDRLLESQLVQVVAGVAATESYTLQAAFHCDRENMVQYMVQVLMHTGISHGCCSWSAGVQQMQ